MAPHLSPSSLTDHAWFREFLKTHGFAPADKGCFTNGRATIRVKGALLHAIPADNAQAWQTNITGVPPDALRQLLTTVLAAPGFLSQTQLDHQANRRRSASEALQVLTDTIREQPDSQSGHQLRRLVWSLFNGHHALNLWRLKDVLDGPQTAAVKEVISAWLAGDISEDVIRVALVDSGEMDRWDVTGLADGEHRQLVGAMDAVTAMINATAPGPAAQHLARVNDLLRDARHHLQKVSKRSTE